MLHIMLQTRGFKTFEMYGGDCGAAGVLLGNNMCKHKFGQILRPQQVKHKHRTTQCMRQPSCIYRVKKQKHCNAKIFSVTY